MERGFYIMFEIIICDDDDACLDQTGQLVNDWCATVTAPVRVKTIDNGEELLGYCRQNTPDIILLDIMMPVFSGMDAAKAIREHNSTSKIIFLTSSPEFAIESYDVNATGYLLKPVDKDRLHRLLEQCLSTIQKPMDSVTLHTSAGYQNIYLLRHDMWHFLNNIATLVENGESEKALDYIHGVVKATEKTISKRYCANEIINVILMSNASVFSENNIDFRYSVSVPSILDIPDTDMTSILQNALENALHAVLLLEPDKRFIRLSITVKNGKLLISVENPYAERPKMANGMPVTTNRGHGLGTNSIQQTVGRLNGNCQFSVTDSLFIVRIII